jgi:hypothetical protein
MALDDYAKMLNRSKVNARLAKLPAAVTAAKREQLEKEVDALVEAEKRAAPVSELEDHPGQLRDSIQAHTNADRPLSYRIIVGARDKFGRLFGRYVEFGHTSRGGQYVPAHAFWFPTYRSRKKAMRQRLFAAPRKVLKALFPGDTYGL